ncbi:4-diphosphocytidyl-2-C-methyl-D-erythritol kinase [Micrococcales bacterium KH10]|nr:4-diphosphocytidyl-2-C-methyl-D-erythritol kinase [Micrococcales bacterium KH10]
MNESLSTSVTARTWGKVNLSLRSGPVDHEGYHPLRTVFASLSLPESVTVSPADELRVSVQGLHADRVPLDESNLAVQAAQLLAQWVGRSPDVAIEITKGVPVEGGMGGGSADAGATLLALNELWNVGLHRRQLAVLARPLGADVPFTVVGGVALGTGRGDVIQPLESAAQLHFALGFQDEGLSTAAVYREVDAMGVSALRVDAERELIDALRAGDLAAIGACLHNDLQPVALALMPRLGDVLSVASAAGALGTVVSGSGPTVAALARDAEHAAGIAREWDAAGVCSSTLAVTSAR